MSWESPAIAAVQYGAFTRGQAVAAGVTQAALRHRVIRGTWVRLFPRVCATAVAAQHADCWCCAALLAAGAGAALSHATAAELHGLTVGGPELSAGLHGLTVGGPEQSFGASRIPSGASGRPTGTPERAVHVRVRGRRHVRPAAGLCVHRPRHLPLDETTVRRRLVVTTLERTVLDVLTDLPEPDAIALVAAVVQQRRTTASRLARSAERAGAGVGARRLRRVLATLEPGHQSLFEVELARLVRRSGLPAPAYNVTVQTPDGPRRPDMFWPVERVGVEADGALFHLGPERWEEHLLRDEAFDAADVRMVHVTYRQLRQDPQRVLARIRRASRDRSGGPLQSAR